MPQLNSLHSAQEGSLLIGSLPLPDTETALRRCGHDLGPYLRRVPDGETGKRWYFVGWQNEVFQHCPKILGDFAWYQKRPDVDLVDEDIDALLKAQPLQLQFDEYAIASYQTFARLRDEEKLFSPATRFQISLPTAVNTIGVHIRPEYRLQIEPFYEEALYKTIDNIQTQIPKQSLAIQLDMAVDMAIVEGVLVAYWDTKQESPLQGVISRAVRMASHVDAEVELGFHLCYGDMGHKHWKEPADTELLAKVAVGLLEAVPRKIDWIHLPVPIERTDDAYFAPLSALLEAKERRGLTTSLYLGLVHPNDEEGTRNRMSAAQKVLKGEFGIATECGMGRTPLEELDSIFAITRTFADPVTSTEH